MATWAVLSALGPTPVQAEVVAATRHADFFRRPPVFMEDQRGRSIPAPIKMELGEGIPFIVLFSLSWGRLDKWNRGTRGMPFHRKETSLLNGPPKEEVGSVNVCTLPRKHSGSFWA